MNKPKLKELQQAHEAYCHELYLDDECSAIPVHCSWAFGLGFKKAVKMAHDWTLQLKGDNSIYDEAFIIGAIELLDYLKSICEV